MNRILTRLATIAVASACLASASAQTTVSIVADKDNTLYDDTSGMLSGGQGEIFVGITAFGFGGTRRGLMHFDVAGNVPAGALVIGAEIEFTITNTATTTTDDANFHRVDQDWGEGTSGGPPGMTAGAGGGPGYPATTNDTTWVHTFYPSSTWTNLGGDYQAIKSFAVPMTNPGAPFTSLTIVGSNMRGLIDDVQDMLDNPATNFGWLLRVNEESPIPARRIASRESATGQPTLRVTYLEQGDVGTVGIGCPVGSGTSTLEFVGPAIGGQSLTLNRTNTVQTSVGSDFFSLGIEPNGVPIQPNCSVYLPLSQEFVGVGAFLSANGSSSGSVLLPAGFPGFLISCQSVVLDNSPLGLSLSNAAVILLQ